jgi:GTP-binding protein
MQCDFQVVYASGIHGKAGLEPNGLADDLEPLFEAVLRCVPEPRVDLEGPLQMLVSLSANHFVSGLRETLF